MTIHIIPDGAKVVLEDVQEVDGYDGHSLRAHSYFPEKMPDIELAPEEGRCFEAMIGEQKIWFHEHERITYLGQEMSGLELWDRLMNVRVAAE